MTIQSRNNYNEPFILDKYVVNPGENVDARIKVGKLPSDVLIHLEARVYRSKNPGPTVLIIGGVHGDEINGIQLIRKAIIEDVFSSLSCGSVIAIPLLNIFGFINFSREVPDGKDINRSFPGVRTGSMASRVAYTLTKKILPYVDCILDFHTGGGARHNHPQVRFNKKDTASAELARIFDSKFLIEKPFIPKSLRKISFENGIPVVVYEGGESVRLDGNAIESGINGIKNVLHHFGMIPQKGTMTFPERILCQQTSWLRASKSGIFIWAKKSGDYIEKGQILGTIGDPYGRKTVEVKASKSGYIIGHNNASVVSQGDALFHIAFGYEKL